MVAPIGGYCGLIQNLDAATYCQISNYFTGMQIINHEKKSNKALVGIISIAVIIYSLRYLFSLSFGLVPDEAYYWDWTRSLSLGYFDHPPLVAWLGWVGCHLFGNTIAGVRFGAFAGSLIAVVASILLARNYLKTSSSLLMLLLVFNAAIICSVGLLLLTPDVPLIAFWALALWQVYRAVYNQSRSAWVLMGIFGGLGMLSKYTFVLFFVALGVFLLADSKARRFWFSPWLWLSGLISLLIFSVNLFWNSQHQWISFGFQIKHGLSAQKLVDWNFLGEYIGGQIGVLSIFLFVILIIAIVFACKKSFRDSSKNLLVVFTVVPLCFFAASSLRNHVEPNWPAMAYISGFILIGWLFDIAVVNRRKFLRWFIVSAVVIGLIASTGLLVHIVRPWLPMPPGNDVTLQMKGWKTFAKSVDSSLIAFDPGRRYPLCANGYPEAALLSFYMPEQPQVVALNLGVRDNNYSFLSITKKIKGDTLLFIDRTENGILPAGRVPYFSGLQIFDTLLLTKIPGLSVEYGLFKGVLQKAD